jgi:hypothetical protein
LSAFKGVDERVDAQYVVQVNRQVIVGLPINDPTRQTPSFPQSLGREKRLISIASIDVCNLSLIQSPACKRENDAAHPQAR